MASSRVIEKKWVENFKKSPLVDKDSMQFNQRIAHQLFYGKEDPEYPDDFPHGFKTFYDQQYAEERSTCVDTTLHYLHFVGIRMSRTAIDQYLILNTADFHKFIKKAYFILRTLASNRYNHYI